MSKAGKIGAPAMCLAKKRRPCLVSGSRESRLVLDKGKREEKVNLLDFFTSELS